MLFTYADTKEFETDSKIVPIYDSLTFYIGKCYSNIESLSKELRRCGILDFSTYVGWVLMGNGLIHHCWLVYKEKHVLDPGITKIHELARIKMQQEQPSIERGREIFLELFEEFKHVPNRQYHTFGQVAPFAVYIGTEYTPSLGREIFRELIDKFPNHPAYSSSGMNPHGASELQKN